MRIVVANWSRNIVGGAEKYLQAIMPSLAARGHDLAFLHELTPHPSSESIDVPEYPIPFWNVAELGIDTAIRALERWRPDVVYAHGLESSELEAALVRTYPTVLFAHNYYGTCGTGTKSYAFPQLRPCGRRFGPMCAVLHYPRRCGGLNPLVTSRLFRRQMQRNSALPHFRTIIVASQHMYEEFSQHLLTQENLHLILLPSTDVTPSSSPPAPKVPQRRVLMVGRLTNLKGGHYLIQALACASRNLGTLSLTIAGQGPERENLQELAVKYQVPVEFIDWVATPEKLELMRQADLLAVPSLWPEPFGLVGIEAGCIGLPAVGYAVGGITDWLIPGHSGELASGDPPSVAGLAEAIGRALADPEHYSRLCRGAWEVAKGFNLEAHLGKLDQILCSREIAPIATPCLPGS